MCEIFLTKCHPKTGTLNGGVVLDKTLNFFMMEQVALFRTNVGVGEWLVNFKRLCFNPTAIFPIKSLLCNFTNVDFGIEIGGKGIVVVTCIAVDNVKILNLVKMMLGSIGCVNACYTGVKATTQNGS